MPRRTIASHLRIRLQLCAWVDLAAGWQTSRRRRRMGVGLAMAVQPTRVSGAPSKVFPCWTTTAGSRVASPYARRNCATRNRQHKRALWRHASTRFTTAGEHSKFPGLRRRAARTGSALLGVIWRIKALAEQNAAKAARTQLRSFSSQLRFESASREPLGAPTMAPERIAGLC